MKEEKPFEKVTRVLPGDEVLRRLRRPRRALRAVPRVPAIFRFMRDIITQTPFIPMLSLLVFLWLVFSAGVYFAEQGASESPIHSYGRALYWSVAAFSTAGLDSAPVTAIGQIIGGLFIVVGSVIFFGAIIAGITVYFTLPGRHSTRQIISTIQYNLGQIENLSVDELEALKQTTVGIIEAQMERLKGATPPGS